VRVVVVALKNTCARVDGLTALWGETKHVAAEDFERIAWRGRMRIVMGLAYCVQHMHELSPPVAHPDMQSSSVLLSEDGAAKVHTPVQHSSSMCLACY
jgi:hypothetical protein